MCIFAFSSAENKAASEQETGGSEMPRWNYKILTATDPTVGHGVHVLKCVNGEEIQNWKQHNWPITDALNELGQDGWELVEVIWRQWGKSQDEVSDPVFILKRDLDENIVQVGPTSSLLGMLRAGNIPEG
jgi:hypothetical protein